MMIHNGRCGSTVVGLLLNRHPRMHWAGELFYERRLQKYNRINPDFSYTDIIRNNEYRAGNQLYGLEIKPLQLCAMKISKEQFMSDMRSLGFDSYILLERRNYLRREISSEIARATGRFKVKSGDVAHLSQVHLNTETLLSVLDNQTQDMKEMKELLKDKYSLHISFEYDVLPDPCIAYQKICTHLRLPYVPFTLSLSRTNPYRMDQMLLNYEQVANVLRGTPYEYMLNDEQ